MTEAVDFHLKYDGKAPGKGEVIHPLYAEYKRILMEELEFYRYIQTLAEAARFMDSYMGITMSDLSYKSKIKGFHLAFNTV